jgi:hypothetical protein
VAENHSRKADPHRDEQVYLTILEARENWKKLPKHEREVTTYWDLANKMLGFPYSDEAGYGGILKAFYRGRNVHRTQNYETQKTGRKSFSEAVGFDLQGHWQDAVAEIVIYDLVEDALKQGLSLNAAYNLVSGDENAMMYKKGRIVRPSASSVRLVHERIRKHYESKTPRS